MSVSHKITSGSVITMLGLSKEIKTKYFSAINGLLDDKINQWLSDNDVEVVNININSNFEALLVYRPRN